MQGRKGERKDKGIRDRGRERERKLDYLTYFQRSTAVRTGTGQSQEMNLVRVAHEVRRDPRT